MKKITLFAFAFAALSLASCKKARTCTCTSSTTNVTTYSDGSPSSTSSSSGGYTDVSTTKLSKKSAKAWCTSGTMVSTTTDAYTGGLTVTGTSTQVESCSLK